MREETAKTTTLQEEIESLRRLTARGLREKYLEVFGEESRSGHKQFLFRRIDWRIQANALGGLSERARQRALEIADDADLRICAARMTQIMNLLNLAPEIQEAILLQHAEAARIAERHLRSVTAYASWQEQGRRWDRISRA